MVSSTSAFISAASLLLLVLALFPPDVSGIWCFQCNSQIDEDCLYIQPNDTSSRHYRQCSDDEQSMRFNGSKKFFCRKIVQKIYDRDGLERVVRRCGYIQHKLPCYGSDNKGHSDVVCQCFTDACNSARSLPLPVMLLLILSVIHVLRTASK